MPLGMLRIVALCLVVLATGPGSAAPGAREEAEKAQIAKGVRTSIEWAMTKDKQALFDCFARQWFYLGPWGTAARMKLVVNLVLGLNRAVLAEGLAFARACGLDPAVALGVLRAGAAYSRVMDTKGPKMVGRDFEPQLDPRAADFEHRNREHSLGSVAGADHDRLLTFPR